MILHNYKIPDTLPTKKTYLSFFLIQSNAGVDTGSLDMEWAIGVYMANKSAITRMTHFSFSVMLWAVCACVCNEIACP